MKPNKYGSEVSIGYNEFAKNINQYKEIRAMAHYNTILQQLTSIFPRHDFEKLAKIHHRGQKFRSFNRWSQFLAMMIAQVSGLKSLRDITDNIKTQGNRIYHLGMRQTTRATLARVNEKQPHNLYKAMFYTMLSKCSNVAPKHRFKFKGKVFLLDATTIDLCLSVFSWAKFRKTKGAIKLHIGLDIDGYLPTFMDMTDGKFHEIGWARSLNLPSGSCVVFDRGFTDYSWYQDLTEKNITFVTRLKKNAKPYFPRKKPGRKSPNVTEDKTVMLEGVKKPLRIVSYKDPETEKEYDFLTNALHLKAVTIADLYKERWKIEQFFRWIKQNLKIKTFLGTSANAVLTQIWIALCVYLLLSFMKFKAKLGISITKILRLLHLNLFARRSLEELLKPPDKQALLKSPQLVLWSQL
jgi:hypothetical protein